MSESNLKRENFSVLEELGYLNLLQQEALIRILIHKGIINEEEFLELVKAVHEETQGHAKN